MKRQPKSGSKSRPKKSQMPVKAPRMIEHADGSRTIPLDDEMVKLLEEQRQAFRDKFGREPEGNEPIFFDPDYDVPTRMSEEKLLVERKVTAEAMERAGIRPEMIHAYMRTGRILTADNHHLVPVAGRNEWNAAVDEYFEWQELAQEARAAGAPAAVVYAIGKTGKVRPESFEFSEDGTHVTASGDDADWLEAVNEYVERHPESFDPSRVAPANPKKDRIH